MSRYRLTTTDQLLLREYLVDRDVFAAFKRVHPTAKPATVLREALRWLAMERISARLKALRLAPRQPAFQQPAAGAARHQMQYWRLSCPHCYERHDPMRDPNPDCEECQGRGQGRTVIVDVITGRAELSARHSD